MTEGPVVVVGDVMRDVSVRLAGVPAPGSDAPATIEVRPGGSGANAAAWLARLGERVVFAACVGDDDVGGEAARVLAEDGVTTRLAVAEGHTGACVLIVAPDGERTTFTDPGANARLDPADLPRDAFAAGGHLHLSGYSLLRPGSRAAATAALTAAREAGMRASVDPSSTAPLRALGAEAFLGLAAGAGLVIATRAEAEVLTGSADPERAAAALAEGRDGVVLKLGAEGALWRSGAGETVRVPAAAPPRPVVDQTGAGDAFAAAWIAARRGGAGARDALDAACALAAEVVTRPGAR